MSSRDAHPVKQNSFPPLCCHLTTVHHLVAPCATHCDFFFSSLGPPSSRFHALAALSCCGRHGVCVDRMGGLIAGSMAESLLLLEPRHLLLSVQSSVSDPPEGCVGEASLGFDGDCDKFLGLVSKPRTRLTPLQTSRVFSHGCRIILGEELPPLQGLKYRMK